MSDDFPVTIFHNPNCGTSRNVLGLIRAAGYQPTVIEYLQTGWTRPQLEGLVEALWVSPRELLREKGTPAEALGLLGPAVTNDELLSAMVEHPILVNRPIVITPKGARLARPSEAVLDLLDRRSEQFSKETASGSSEAQLRRDE